MRELRLSYASLRACRPTPAAQGVLIRSLHGFVPARATTGPAAGDQSRLHGWARGSAILSCLLRALPDGSMAGFQEGAEAPLAQVSGQLWGLWVRGRWLPSQLDLWGQASTGTRLRA